MFERGTSTTVGRDEAESGPPLNRRATPNEIPKAATTTATKSDKARQEGTFAVYPRTPFATFYVRATRVSGSCTS
jgi:hypothetical protein